LGKYNGKFLGKGLFAAVVSLKDDRIKKEFYDVISMYKSDNHIKGTA